MKTKNNGSGALTKNEVPLCVMCHEELVGVDIGQGIELGVCKNPACANFSLYCMPEGAIKEKEGKE